MKIQTRFRLTTDLHRLPQIMSLRLGLGLIIDELYDDMMKRADDIQVELDTLIEVKKTENTEKKDI